MACTQDRRRKEAEKKRLREEGCPTVEEQGASYRDKGGKGVRFKLTEGAVVGVCAEIVERRRGERRCFFMD